MRDKQAPATPGSQAPTERGRPCPNERRDRAPRRKYVVLQVPATDPVVPGPRKLDPQATRHPGSAATLPAPTPPLALPEFRDHRTALLPGVQQSADRPLRVAPLPGQKGVQLELNSKRRLRPLWSVNGMTSSCCNLPTTIPAAMPWCAANCSSLLAVSGLSATRSR